MKLVKIVIALLLVYNLPSLNGQIIDTLCSPAIGKYGVHGTAGSTFWWTARGGTIISPNGVDTVVVDWIDDPGVYDLQVIEISANGCPGDTVYAKVFVTVATKIVISGPDSLCFGDDANLTCSSNGYLHRWFWDNGDTSKSIHIFPMSNTTYSVVGIGYCNNDTASHTVTVNPVPIADFTYQPSYPEVFNPVQFTYTGTNVVNYNWHSEHHGYFSSLKNPYIIYNDPAEDYITLEVWNKHGCYDTVKKPLVVIANPKLFVPNSFTPNGDGINDEFKAVGHHVADFHLLVYDRWGSLVFETSNMDSGWDGTVSGRNAASDAYAWIIRYRGLTDPIGSDQRVKKGTVTLLR